MTIEIIRSGTLLITDGLSTRGHVELSADTCAPALIEEGVEFLRTISRHILERGTRIESGQTISYGYWTTKFIATENGKLDAWEYNSKATEYVHGVALTLTYWRDQHGICRRYDAGFHPPKPESLVAISEGVFQGDPVQGVRYPSPPHMSGWWITTDRYDGNITSIRTEHLYHLTAARPELARYLALPFGFRFDLANAEDVWFEDDVARRPME